MTSKIAHHGRRLAATFACQRGLKADRLLDAQSIRRTVSMFTGNRSEIVDKRERAAIFDLGPSQKDSADLITTTRERIDTAQNLQLKALRHFEIQTNGD